jgi:hypothetical protein
LPPAGNSFLFFFLIVCTFVFLGAWKTRLLFCIPGYLALRGECGVDPEEGEITPEGGGGFNPH